MASGRALMTLLVVAAVAGVAACAGYAVSYPERWNDLTGTRRNDAWRLLGVPDIDYTKKAFMNDRELIGQIVGEQLSAVSFVQDYVEFHGPVIRAFAGPIVEERGDTVRFPAPSSRDKLCSLIARSVSSFELIDALELRIRLGGADLIVPLDAERNARRALRGCISKIL